MADGCAAATGKARQCPRGPGESASRRQDDFSGLAAKGDQRHLIAPHIAFRKQKLHCALGFAKALQGRRAGGIDHEDCRGAAAGLALHDAEILAPHSDCACDGVRATAQALPGGGGTQGVDDRNARSGAQIAGLRAHDATTLLQPRGRAGFAQAAAAHIAGLHQGQQACGQGGEGCGGHQIVGRGVAAMPIILVGG